MVMVPETRLLEIYGEEYAAEAQERYRHLTESFRRRFQRSPEAFFSSPGRTEIIGNHTDHNGGRILAASISLDTIAAAARTEEPVVSIVSEGYHKPIEIDLTRLGEVPLCQGSLSLTAGILKAALEAGFQIGGFQAYVTSKVIPAAGVSSSASFEMLICSILNQFFNGGKIDCPSYARMGQYAENVYWKKGSGLMDQMACAVGGTILLDFSDGVHCEKMDFSFDRLGCDLLIVNTGKGHSDLSAEYSTIPDEMHAAANALGCRNLCESTEEEFLKRLPEIRKQLKNDRAVLRALHYYEECTRVDNAVAALRRGEDIKMLDYMREGGNSSWKQLQNGYVISDYKEQSIPVVLTLAEIYMNRTGKGTCRIHGGGYAGVVMCVLPKENTEDFINYLAPYVGRNNIYRMGIRQTGAVCVHAV